MKKVLVTGAGGFIGRPAAKSLLERGFDVHGVDLTAPPHWNDEVVWHQADLLDSHRLRAVLESVRPSHLLHLAWCTTPGEYWTSEANLTWVGASLSLIQAFIEFGGQRVVVAGTC
ncbi:MAG: NAD-dependent epimerase/dehydratase family protein, partial [Thermodesulfobacteriota bacterium]